MPCHAMKLVTLGCIIIHKHELETSGSGRFESGDSEVDDCARCTLSLTVARKYRTSPETAERTS